MIALPNKQLTSLAIFAVQSWTKVYHNNFFVFKVRCRAQFRSPKCARVTFVQYRYISFFISRFQSPPPPPPPLPPPPPAPVGVPFRRRRSHLHPTLRKKIFCALHFYFPNERPFSSAPKVDKTNARSLSVSLPASSLADRHALRPLPPPPSSSSLVSEGSDDARRTAEQGGEETIIRKEEDEDVGHLRAISIPSYSDPPPLLILSLSVPPLFLYSRAGETFFSLLFSPSLICIWFELEPCCNYL